ncbi:hypothetical protein VPH35_058352 [Triticum aestivum]
MAQTVATGRASGVIGPGQVITLDLSNRNLRSTSGLSLALFNLTSLTNLSLSGNDFGLTSLPSFGFERLTELLSLNFSNTRLFGQIPIGIGHLQILRTLDLYSHIDWPGYAHNDLYLRDPSFQTFVSNFCNLRNLYLDNVQIHWMVLFILQFSQLRFLATMDLGLNGISGKVPGFFAEFPFLRDLTLRANDFEGQFPTNIFLLKYLKHLDLSYNPSLYVQLPDFPPRNGLQSLNLLETNIFGGIPDSFVHLNSLKFLGLSNIGSHKQPITSIANLTSLNGLWLSGSGIEKPMLSWVGRFENLIYLSLHDYNFSGPIPWWIRNCTNLMSLWLRQCSLSGAIPTWIGNLAKLSDLNLSYNRLSGNVPKALFTLPSLQELLLSSNELCGSLEDIPNPISSLLYSIELRDNNFAGHIPKSFFDLTRLQVLLLDSNYFEGTVELGIIWKLNALDFLMLSDNILSVIDVEDGYPLPYLPHIRYLGLAYCNLTIIPGTLRYTNQLSYLDLSNNKIHGVIPSWIWVNWKESMFELNLSNNMFTSLENSPSLVQMDNLKMLDLSSNKLHGTVPIPVTTTSSSALLDWSDNSFSSIIPDFGRYLPNNTIHLDLSRNKLYGNIPGSICTQKQLKILDLSYNNFSGMMPACLIEGSSLGMLKLRDNHLHGILPENIGDGCMLQTIDLNNNQIEGKIPRSLCNCRNLEVLDIGSNQILDTFPSWLGEMSNLRILFLRSNQLYGSIGGLAESDASSKDFSALQIIDLASNNFSGSLSSKWFDMLQRMTENSSDKGNALAFDSRFPGEYYQERLTFKGIDLTFTKILTTFKMLDFSNNAFDGPIPDSVGNLIALHGLNMSHNAFTVLEGIEGDWWNCFMYCLSLMGIYIGVHDLLGVQGKPGYFLV